MAPKTQPAPTETETQPAPFVKQVGKFTFAATRGVVIPEVLPTPQRDSLPFAEIFENAHHNDYFFIPVTFWTSPKVDGGRGIAASAATPKWQKDKIKGAMNDWRKKDLAKRSGHKVVVIERKKGQPIDANDPKKGEYETDGVGFWVQIAADMAPPPAE